MTYEEFRQKLAALAPMYAEVEELLRKVFTEKGHAVWTSLGEQLTFPLALNFRSETSDFQVSAGDFVDVDATAGPVTVTFPSASDSKGASIYIRKSDSSTNQVITPVKSLAFQGTVIRFISNGSEWVPS